MFRNSLLSFIILSSPLVAFSFTQHSQLALTPVQSAALSLARVAPAEIQSRFSSSTETFFKSSSFTALGSSPSETVDTTAATEAAESTSKKPLPLSTRKAVVIGTVLAMTSGFINGACASGFFSPSQFTAAVTGTWTNSALALAKGQNQVFIKLAKYLFMFMSGSTIAGLFVPEPVPFEVTDPKGVACSFGVGSLCLAVAGVMAKTGGLSSESILSLCFIANGIQNSLTSAFTANLCRTTHFSGITSDIGTFLSLIHI